MVLCDSNITKSIQSTSWEDGQYDKSLVFLKSENFNASNNPYSLSLSYVIKSIPLLNILFFSNSVLFYYAVCTSYYTYSTGEM
jgi:hypothetical protein